MIVCHKCGNKTESIEEKTVLIRVLDANSGLYEFSQSFNLCTKCKDKLLDAVSEVISNCDSYQIEPAAVKSILKELKKDEKKTTKKKKQTLKTKDVDWQK